MSTSTDRPAVTDNGTGEKTLASALVAAQADMPAVQPDAVNPHFKSRFVSLGHLVAKVRPVLNKHGLMVAQFPSSHGETGAPTLVTILLHESGERIEYEAPLVLQKNDPQGFGSAMTYARRYALASALGISDQEDDDGNAGSAGEAAPAASAPTADSAATPETLNVVRGALQGRKAGQIKLLLVSAGVQDTADVKAAVDSLTQPEAEALITATEQLDAA